MKNLLRIFETIKTEKNSFQLLRRMRWRNGVYCPKCTVIDENHIHQTKSNGCRKYRCKACQHLFSDTSGSMFHKSKIPLNQWFYAIYELSQKKGITSIELAGKMGIPQKKAWAILHKIRLNLTEISKTFLRKKMKGVVESDEANFGKSRNAVMGQGILQRKGIAIIKPISDRTEATLKGNISSRVCKGSTVITDTDSAYNSLCC